MRRCRKGQWRFFMCRVFYFDGKGSLVRCFGRRITVIVVCFLHFESR
jgi:hypothetical protein